MNSPLFSLLGEAEGYGVSFKLENNRVFVKVPKQLPSDFMQELRNRKTEIHDFLQKKQRRIEADNWALNEWRKTSLPAWRRILKESIEAQDKHRENYARWMLREVLEDEEYREP